MVFVETYKIHATCIYASKVLVFLYQSMECFPLRPGIVAGVGSVREEPWEELLFTL